MLMTDGTIALTEEGRVEALNAGVHFPLGTSVPTKPLFEFLPTGVQTFMSNDLTITNHVMDTIFFTQCYTKIKYYFHFRKAVYRCPRRNGQNFGRVFLMLNYTDITQNTYIQS